LIMWCPVVLIVKRPADVDVLAFAAAHGWIEVSSGADSVRVTEAGRRVVQ
jgi:hypothetical protein